MPINGQTQNLKRYPYQKWHEKNKIKNILCEAIDKIINRKTSKNKCLIYHLIGN